MTHEDALRRARLYLGRREVFRPDGDVEAYTADLDAFARALLSLSARCDSMSAVVRELRGMLGEACDELDGAWPYAGDYFEDKWRDKDREAKWRQAAALDSLDADKERG
jgi:hypothetical protein